MSELFSQILDLKEKDVFLETEINDNLYFNITGLPPIISYGKHPFTITFNDPENQPLLKNLSNIIFEFVDSRGVVIFSNLVDIEELSGAGNGFVWIKKDPLRTADEIADGPAFFYVMGELDGQDIPSDWKGIYNIRSTFQYDIRKDYPNTSPLIISTPLDIQKNITISESIDLDTDSDIFKRSFINVSLQNMETNGGKIESVELSYNEQNAKTDDFEIITTYPLLSGSFETTDQNATSGINPISNTTKIVTPKEFRRDTPVRFRLRFLNPAKQLAQHLDEDRQGEIIEITSSFITFDGSPFFIEKEDNLLKGSLFTGNAVGKGFEQSGKNSAFLKTVDYEGFESASLGLGSSGVMFFSGSVLTGSGDNYDGVGLELFGTTESFFRFRTDPSILDIRAQSFFVGSETTQFISGSGGQIEISSSLFHLDPSTSTLVMSGSISASSGQIGGWDIRTDKLVNSENTVELNSSTPGLNILDAGGTERVTIKSGSFLTIGEGQQYIGNKSFEDDSISVGRNIVNSATSWSFSLDGKASASLTDRSSLPDKDGAVSGDTTLDIIVPEGSQNYASPNRYQIVQIITASFTQGDTLSFGAVARFSSSFGGKGKDRALGPQYFRVEYSSSNSDGFKPFLPASDFTASNGYGEYFLGTGQYNSFGASAEMPEAADFVRVVLSGSINDDSGYTIKKPLFAERKRNKSLGKKEFSKQIVGSATPEFPETEITFDNFSLRSNTRKVELTEKGLLIYNSEDSFLKMDATGIEFRGGSGVSAFGSSISRESFTNDSDVAGRLGAPALQPYSADPEDIGTSAFDGNVGEFAKGNHRHRLTVETVNSVLNGQDIQLGSLIATGSITAQGDIIAENYIVRSNVTQITQSFSSGSTIFGDTLDDTHQFTGSLLVSSSNITIDNNGDISAGVITATSFDGNFIGALSSSAQISDEISGSFIEPSASLSLRTKNLEAASSSFSTRTSDLEEASSSFSTRTTNLEVASASISSRLSSEEANVDELQSRQIITGLGLTGGGNLTADRTLTVDFSDTNLQTTISGSFLSTSSSIASDIAEFKDGTINLISGSSTSTGSFGQVIVNGVLDVTKVSSSLSTRISIEEANVDGLQTDSGSFSTRITNLKNDSGSFSTRISNLKNDSGSFSTRISNLKNDSGSFSTRVTLNEQTGSKILNGELPFTNITASNNVSINGDLKLGDNLSDSHLVTGSLSITGSFTVNGGGVATTPGNDKEVVFNDGGVLGSTTNFTFDKTTNHLSASLPSTASFGKILQNGETLASVGGADTNVLINTGGVISGSGGFVYDDSTNRVGIGTDSPTSLLHLNASTADLLIQDSDGTNQTFTIQHSGANTFMTSRNGSSHGAFFLRTFNGSTFRTALSIDSNSNIEFANASTISGSSTSTGSFGRLAVSGLNIIDNNAFSIGLQSGVKRIDSAGGGTDVYRFIDASDNITGIRIASANVSDKLFLKTDGSVSGSSTSTGSFGRVFAKDSIQIGGPSDVGSDSAKLVIDKGSNGTAAISFGRNNGADIDWTIHTIADESLAIDGIRQGEDLLIRPAPDGGSATEVLRISANGNKISGSSTSTGSFGRVHIGNSGTAPSQFANNLVINQTAQTTAGISILTSNSGVGRIFFGDTDNQARAYIIYDHNNDIMKFSSVSGNRLTLTDTVAEFETANYKISGSSTSTGSFGSAHIADKVGIGTTSPIYALHVEAGNDLAAKFSNDGDRSRILINDNDTEGYIVVQNSLVSIGQQNSLSADNLNIDGSGNIGIGTTSPDAPLELTPGAIGTTSTVGGLSINDGLKINTTSGRSGVTVVTSNDFLDTSTNAAFQFLYPYDDTSSSNDKTYKAFRIAHGSDITGSGDSFSVDKFGNVLTTGDISGSSTSTGSFGELHIADKVGIGTTSPNRLLTLVGSTAAINLDSAGNSFITIDRGAVNDVGQIEFKTAGSAKWYVGMGDSGNFGDGSEFFIGEGSGGSSDIHFLINSSGNIGIGTDSPEQLLHLRSEAPFLAFTDSSNNSESGVLYRNTSGTNVGFALYDFGNNAFKIRTSSNLALTIDSSGNAEFHRGNISGSSTSTGSFGDGVISNTLAVGTSSPRKPLHVFHPTTNIAALFQSGDSQALISFRDNSTGDDNHVMIGANGTNFVLSTDNAERIRVDEDGKVGIGKTNPSDKLEIADGAVNGATYMNLNNNHADQFLSLGINGNVGEIAVDNGDSLSFGTYTNKSTKTLNTIMTITNDGQISGSSTSTGSFGAGFFGGRLGIGTTSPGHRFEVEHSDDTVAQFKSTDNNGQIIVADDDTTAYFGANGNRAFMGTASGLAGNTNLVVNSSGQVGIGTTSPNTELTVRNSANNSDFIRGENAGGGRVFSVGTDASGHSNLSIRNSSDTQVVFLSGDSSVPSRFASVSGSSTSTGSFGRLQLDNTLLYDNAILDVGRSAVADPTVLIDSATGGDPQLIFDTGTSNRTGIIQFKDEGTVAGFIKYEHNGDKMNFGAASSTSVRMTVSEAAIEFPTANVKVSGSSSSTGSFASGFFADSVGIGVNPAANRALKVVGNVQIGDSSDTSDYLFFQHNGTDGRLVSNRGKLKLEAQSSAHIVELVSAGISGSSTSTGSFGMIGVNTASPSNTFHAFANVSNKFVALIENDQASSGHGLKVHSDGGGTGTILLDLDGNDSSVFRVLAEGTTTIGGSTTIDGNISGSSTSTGSFGNLTVANDLMMPNGRVLNWGTSHGTLGSAIVGNSSTNVLVFYTNGSERARFNSSGILDFGVTSNNSQVINLRKNSTSVTGLGVNDNFGVRIAGPSDSTMPVSFGEISTSDGTTFTERMRIDGSGNIGIGTDSPSLLLTIADDGDVGTNTFISGVAGDGFRIKDNGSSGVTMEIDNVLIRNTLRTHIFQKDTVKATNGILFISDSGVISGSNGSDKVTFINSKSATFSDNTQLLYKDIDESTGDIREVRFTINGTGTDDGTHTTYDVDNVEGSLAFLTGSVGATAVRISGGSLALDASSPNSPFMDVNSSQGSGSTVVRVGNLDGITSPRFGTLDGFGLWASGSAYLEGNINAKHGNIGGWGIGETAISSSGNNISIDAGINRITITDGSADRIYLGEVDGNGSALPATDDQRYGLKIFDGSGTTDSDLLVELGEGQNMIVGWDLTPGNIQSDNADGSVRFSSTKQALSIFTGSIDDAQPKLVLGKLPINDGTVNQPYGLAVFDGVGNVTSSVNDASASVLITANKARLAGWELVPGRLKSGTVADINGNNASIALGTNATTATGTPTDGLFFVSASTKPVFYVGSTFSYVNDVLKAGGWEIGNGQISASTGTAQIISSNGGAFALGTTPPTNYENGTGVFLSGSGQALFGNAAGSRVQWTGTALRISSSAFNLTTDGNVTASNALFENVRIVGGAADNTISPFDFANPGFIGGGKSNEILDSNNSFLGGGQQNEISSSDESVVVGGFQNKIEITTVIHSGSSYGDSNYSAILGGRGNELTNPFLSNEDVGDGFEDFQDVPIASERSVIVGGSSNTLKSSQNSAMLGGSSNRLWLSNQAVLVGGLQNRILKGDKGFIGGGQNNYIQSQSLSVIVGGEQNRIGELNDPNTKPISGFGSDHRNFVGGGYSNKIHESQNGVIVGGYLNTVTSSFGSSILNGNLNIVDSSSYSIIGGGYSNELELSYYSAIVAGFGNKISQSRHSSIVVGKEHLIRSGSNDSFIGGGVSNELTEASSSFIGGGRSNLIQRSTDSLIAGGFGNAIDSRHSGTSAPSNSSTASFIGGGIQNTIDSDIDDKTFSNTVIVGGAKNTIRANPNSFLGGGIENTIDGDGHRNVIVGGRFNAISLTSTSSFIGGGELHRIQGSNESAIVAGRSNTITGSESSFIGGGNANNIQNSQRSTILSGQNGNIIESPGATIVNAASSGAPYSNIFSGSEGAIIGGGFIQTIQRSRFASILGGSHNTIAGPNSALDSDFSTIAGGFSNDISSSAFAFIGAGQGVSSGPAFFLKNGNNMSVFHAIEESDFAVKVGGTNGILSSPYGFIGNGDGAFMSGSEHGTIVNGDGAGESNHRVTMRNSEGAFMGSVGQNTHIYNSPGSFIGGGGSNVISGSDYGEDFFYQNSGQNNVIVGGGSNIIGALNGGTGGTPDGGGYSGNSFIGGGGSNKIFTARSAVVVGGSNNEISCSKRTDFFTANQSTIVGGANNKITSTLSFIGGGSGHLITDYGTGTASDNVIVGGLNNTIGNSQYSSILGGRNNQITGSNDDITIIGSNIQLNNPPGNTTYTENVSPGTDNSFTLGTSDRRWSDVHAVQTTTGGVFETGLRTKDIGENPTGTIVSWTQNGLVPCNKNEDELVMGVIKKGKDEPIVMGAEPVLVTGKVSIGDYIVTSDKIGHGKAIKRGYLLKKDLFGKVIAQALESSDDNDSCLIKCMIRKM